MKKESSKSVAAKQDKKTSKQEILEQVGLTLEVFIGEASLTIKELQELSEDSIVTLNASLNCAAEIRLDDSVIALGELVAVGDNFGVRITQISDE